MRGILTPAEIDRVIGTLASRQYGVVSRAQLAGLGVPSGAIDRRIASERLIRVHRGVFSVGHRSTRREARWLAAVLACAEGVVLSHRSAAALWELLPDDGPLTDVTAARRPRHAGIAGHRASLAAEDRAVRRGSRVTSPSRDARRPRACPEGTTTSLRAVRQAQFQRLFDIASMRESPRAPAVTRAAPTPDRHRAHPVAHRGPPARHLRPPQDSPTADPAAGSADAASTSSGPPSASSSRPTASRPTRRPTPSRPTARRRTTCS